MDYEKLYKEALERTKYFMSTRGVSPNEDPFEVAKELSETAFPELKESEDNKTKRMLAIITYKMSQHQPDIFTGEENEWFNAWLEKQGEQKPTMIQWKGDNLKEVIDFTGVYKEGFEKWFHNSWEEYEKYVHEHNNIFKIFNEDGSHIEVPVGAWIVKTPDGYNTASRYVFKQKSAEWSKEDEENLKWFENFFRAESVIAEGKDIPQDRYLWFKSLKGRVQPQPKQEWSEEDERMLKAISIALTLKSAEGYLKSWHITPEEADNWLKFLKERYTWKPSEEHYELEEFAKIVRSNLTGISKAVQELFEAKYLQLTGRKMYGGFKD